MKETIADPIFFICLSIIVYLIACKIQSITKKSFLNPVLLSVVSLIGIISLIDVSYLEYSSACRPISVLLDASVVALALPLYIQWPVVKKQWKRITLSLFLGCISGVVSVICFAYILGASKKVIISLAPKSVTTPIAMSVSEALGGIPPLTAAVVFCVGVFGSIVGLKILNTFSIKKPESIGLAMGAAAHGLGTASVNSLGVPAIAMGGIAIAVNGVFTAIFSPWIVKAFLIIIS
jgi:predicted murein hydrolase (TIGR00659 family)